MVGAVIVAAGSGRRMNQRVKKQFLELGGKPILFHTLSVFDRCPEVDRLVVVVPAEDIDYCRNWINTASHLQKSVKVVPGGSERQQSVFNGLMACEFLSDDDIVLIHDGVRPFLGRELLEACIHAAERHGACIAGAQAVDTMKRVSASGMIECTLERDSIWVAQTPQAFRYGLILDAHREAQRDGFLGTDDSALVERLGRPVHLVPGSRANIKVTTPADLLLAEAIRNLRHDGKMGGA